MPRLSSTAAHNAVAFALDEIGHLRIDNVLDDRVCTILWREFGHKMTTNTLAHGNVWRVDEDEDEDDDDDDDDDDDCSRAMLVVYGSQLEDGFVGIMKRSLAKRFYLDLIALPFQKLPAFLRRAVFATSTPRQQLSPTDTDAIRVQRYAASLVDETILNAVYREISAEYEYSPYANQERHRRHVDGKPRRVGIFGNADDTLSQRWRFAHPKNDIYMRALFVVRAFCEYIVAEERREDAAVDAALALEPLTLDDWENAAAAHDDDDDDDDGVPVALVDSAAQDRFERVCLDERNYRVYGRLCVLEDGRSRLAVKLLAELPKIQMTGGGPTWQKHYMDEVRQRARSWGNEASTDADVSMALVLVRLLLHAPYLLRCHHVKKTRVYERNSRVVDALVTSGSAAALAGTRHAAQRDAMRAFAARHSQAQMMSIELDLGNVGDKDELTSLDVVHTVQSVEPDIVAGHGVIGPADGVDFVLGWSDDAPHRVMLLCRRTTAHMLLYGETAAASNDLETLARSLALFRHNMIDWRPVARTLLALRQAMRFPDSALVDGKGSTTTQFASETDVGSAVRRLERIVEVAAEPEKSIARLVQSVFYAQTNQFHPLLATFEAALTAQAPTVFVKMETHLTKDIMPEYIRNAGLQQAWKLFFKPCADEHRAHMALKDAADRLNVRMVRNLAKVLDNDDDLPRNLPVDSDSDSDDNDNGNVFDTENARIKRAVLGVGAFGVPFKSSTLNEPNDKTRGLADVRAASSGDNRLHLRLLDAALQARRPISALSCIRICSTTEKPTRFVFRVPTPVTARFLPPRRRPRDVGATVAALTALDAGKEKQTSFTLDLFVRVWACVERTLSAGDGLHECAEAVATALDNEPVATTQQQPQKILLRRSQVVVRPSPTTLLADISTSMTRQVPRPLFFMRRHMLESVLLNCYYFETPADARKKV